MAFCPKMNELTFCDASGKISALLDVLPSSDASFYNNVSIGGRGCDRPPIDLGEGLNYNADILVCN